MSPRKIQNPSVKNDDGKCVARILRAALLSLALAALSFLSYPGGHGGNAMTASEIRQSFVQPQLDLLATGNHFDESRSAALAAWETAAQLAELNDNLRTIAEKLER
jgi:hypothetical protein